MGFLDFFKKKNNLQPAVIELISQENENFPKISHAEKELSIIKSLTIDDMRELKKMPYACNTEMKKHIRKDGHPFAYMDIVGENIEIVKSEIQKMNSVIKDTLKECPQISKNIKIPVNDLVFQSAYYGYTRIICSPKTYTGKLAKYPFSLFFTTDLSKSENTTHGELIYGQDGKIQKANIYLWENRQHLFLTYKTINGNLTLIKID